MKNVTFTEHLNNDYSFYNKSQLDSISNDDIKEYRYKIIQDNAGCSDSKNITEIRNAQSDWKHYLEELEVYRLVRFKQDTLDMYDRWVKLAADGDKSYEGMAILVQTVLGKEEMYNMSLFTQTEEIGEFKYIIGLEINDVPDMVNYVTMFMKKK